MAEAADDNTDPLSPDIDAKQAEADAKGEVEESSPDAIKTAALMGWKPLDQWKGDPANWRKAEDFLIEVPEIMRNTRKTIERVTSQNARIVAEVAKLTKTQRQQIDADLDSALDAAVEAGDLDATRKIRAKIRETAAAGAPETNEAPAYSAFKERNDWYEADDAATAFALSLDRQYDKNGSAAANPEAHFRKIETEVKKRFPELSGETKPAPRAPLVARGGIAAQTRQTGDLTPSDLTPQQKRAADDMGVSHKDYVASLNKLNAKEKARA